jgi:cell division protein ZapB
MAAQRLTTENARSIVGGMEKNTAQQMAEQELKRLEYRLDELIKTVERLKDENRSLRSQQQTLTAERASLIERNELARTRVEAMINRLKAMEQNA